ncbi:MAG: PhnD/SsuA/transferrin family substrate-binding protein [Verrucomicrobia bacterium]|nr:PhnD/SsuA/transferrin family substrate-binding protein [Verrucomicrobiota bacterium]
MKLSGPVWKCACLGLLLWAAPARSGAQPVSILALGHGEDLRNAPLLEKTAAYLSQRLPGYEFKVTRVASRNWMAPVEKAGAGLVFMDPAQFIQLEARLPIRPVVSVERFAQGRRTCQSGGVLFSRKDTVLGRPEDLQGRTLAGVQGDPMASTLAVLRELVTRKVDLNKLSGNLILVPNDQTVVEVVLKKAADAGLVTAGVLEQMAAVGRLNLGDIRILSLADTSPSEARDYPFQVSTQLYPERLLAALPGTDPELVRQVAALLLAASRADLDPEGKLEAGWTLPDSREGTRQALRDLHLPPYEQYGKVAFSTVLRQYMYWVIGAGALFVVLGLILSYTTSLNRTLGDEIEERKDAQRSLQESIERFEYIATCSGDWIWETDSEERFTYSNDALQKLLGWPRKELLGKPFFDILSSAEKEMVGDSQKILGADPSAIFHRRVKLLTADGRVAVHDCTAGPIRNKKGEITGFRGVSRDVTAEERMVSFR